MKKGQVFVLLLLLVASAAAVVAFPPGSRRVSQRNQNFQPAPTQDRPSDTVRLLFVGDIMLSRSVGDLMAAKNDWLWPFRAVASVTAEADIAFGNLESVISDRGTTRGCRYCFRADPKAVAGLVHAGFDIVSVANNHAWDYGPEAFTDSRNRLTAAGIAAVGAGREPAVVVVAGTRVAFLAYTDLLPAAACLLVNCYDPLRMVSDVAEARALGDIVVVSFHSGEEYLPATARQQGIYRAAIDAGADLVVGHHPHIVQGLEQYGRGWIAYSLGNFVFDQNWSSETMRGMLLDVTVNDAVVTTVATRQVDISRGYQPRITGGE